MRQNSIVRKADFPLCITSSIIVALLAAFVLLPALGLSTSACHGQAVDAESTEPEGLGAEEGMPVVPWNEAEKVVGRMSIVFGQVVAIGHSKKIHFINFTKQRGNFSVVIFDSAFQKNFEGKLEDAYLRKRIKIRGVVSSYKGDPQIVVSKPEQISVVSSFPESVIPELRTVHSGDELTIGTFNIKNLFDNKDDPYHNDETTPTKPRGEMERVAKVIRMIDADVLALQEVENRGYLERFSNAMLSDLGYKHVVHFEGNDKRGIDVCLLSRVPVHGVTSNRHRIFKGTDGGNQRFSRDVLAVELAPKEGDPFEMWIVHLKSNSGGKPQNEPIRLGECNALRSMLDDRLAEEPNAQIILCGDFNDTFESKTIQTLLGRAPGNSGGAELVPLFGRVPKSDQVTYNREPHRSMIDFLLCSPGMAKRYVQSSYRIRASEEEESGSDHNPVYAQFLKRSPSAGSEASVSAVPVK